MGMANCKDCKHYPMCGFSKYAKAEKCLDFWDVSDVVKVVRCKNCVWCHTLEDLNYCENPRTPWIDDPDFDDITVADNDFCSYGERKDND